MKTVTFTAVIPASVIGCITVEDDATEEDIIKAIENGDWDDLIDEDLNGDPEEITIENIEDCDEEE